MERRVGRRVPIVAAVGAAAALAVGLATPWVGAEANGGGHGHHGGGDDSGKLLFFASDGLRQDAVEKLRRRRRRARLPRPAAHGAQRLRQRPADPGAAEHRRRLVHARDRRVAGRARLDQQHVPHQRRSRSRNSHRGVRARASCRPRRSPRRPSAAARRSPRSSGPAAAAARSTARRSTSATSAPAAAWRRTTSRRPTRGLHRVVRAAVRPPGRVRRQRAVPAGRADGRDRLDQRAALLQPGQGDAPARARRQPTSTSTASTPTSTTARNDGQTRYDRVLFSRTKNGADSGRRPREGEWADVKVTIVTADALDGKTGAFLVKVERLDARPLSRSACSTRRSRARSRPGRPGRASRASPARSRTSSPSASRPRRPATSPSSRPGIVSEETYIEQGLYWEKLYHPLIKYVLDKYKPDLALVGYPVTDEVQHQFLGLVTKKLPNGAKNPAYDDVEVNGTPDHRVKQREALIREAYEGSDATMRLAQDSTCDDRDLTTFVSSDHGFAPQFAAIDASKVLVDLGLLSHAADLQLPPGDRRDDRQGQGLLGRRRGADLPQPRRARPGAAAGAPAGRGGRRGGDGRADQGRVPRARGPQRLDRRRQARGLEGDRPRLHQGRGALHPERRRTARPTWRTRPAPATWSCSRYPPYQFDAATPGHADRPLGVLRPARLRAGRAGPASQHEHARHVPRRRPARSSAARPTTSAASTSRRRRRSCSTSRRRSRARASCGATSSTTGDATRRSRSSG